MEGALYPANPPSLIGASLQVIAERDQLRVERDQPQVEKVALEREGARSREGPENARMPPLAQVSNASLQVNAEQYQLQAERIIALERVVARLRDQLYEARMPPLANWTPDDQLSGSARPSGSASGEVAIDGTTEHTSPTAAPPPLGPWSVEQVRNPNFMTGPLPRAIWDIIRSQVEVWDSRKHKDWFHGPKRGSGHCAERWSNRQGTNRSHPDFACDDCTTKGFVCLQLSKGTLQPMPIRAEDGDRQDLGPEDVGYWVEGDEDEDEEEDQGEQEEEDNQVRRGEKCCRLSLGYDLGRLCSTRVRIKSDSRLLHSWYHCYAL